MAGEPYDGGGIASTVAATRAASDDALRAALAARVAEMRAQGTTTVEIKSGYGLTVVDEERALRLAAEVTPETTLPSAARRSARSSSTTVSPYPLLISTVVVPCARISATRRGERGAQEGRRTRPGWRRRCWAIPAPS